MNEITTAEVTEFYKNGTGFNDERMAAALNEKLVRTNVSRVSITNYRNKKTVPGTDFLLVCAVVYHDWRRNWAIDCLKAKLPEVFVESEIFQIKLPPKK